MLKTIWIGIALILIGCKTNQSGQSALASQSSFSFKSLDELRKAANLSDVYFTCRDMVEVNGDGFQRVNCEPRIPYNFYGNRADGTISVEFVDDNFVIRGSELGYMEASGKFFPFATFEKEKRFVLQDSENDSSDGTAFLTKFSSNVEMNGPRLPQSNGKKQAGEPSRIYTINVNRRSAGGK